MKTSTIMVITAVLITLGSLTAFNINVKKVYQKGDFKSRFKEMGFSPLKGVENIEIKSADRMTVRLEQGDKEGIWIGNAEKEHLSSHFEGNTLVLDLSAEAITTGYRSWAEIIIISKTLKAVNLRTTQAKDSKEDFGNGEIRFYGYHLDQLNLQVGKMVNAELNKMQIHTLRADLGNQKDGKAMLTISSDSKINTAEFNVPGRSTLQLYNPDLVKAVYNLSDSATVTLSGKVVKMIK
jgi:hypothetical protein